MRAHDGLRRTWVVAAREFTERARTRAFQLSTLIAVLGMAALIVVPSTVSDDTKSYRVGLAGSVAAGTSDALAAQAQAADVRVRPTTYGTVAAGEQALRAKEVDVLVVDGMRLEWRGRSNAALATLVANAVQTVRIHDRAAQLGLSMQDVAGLLAPIALSSRQLGSATSLGEDARSRPRPGTTSTTISSWPAGPTPCSARTPPTSSTRPPAGCPARSTTSPSKPSSPPTPPTRPSSTNPPPAPPPPKSPPTESLPHAALRPRSEGGRASRQRDHPGDR
jgi:hypothetical protein